MRIATIIKKIEVHRTAIGKHRDALRELEGELQILLDPTERALEDLMAAIDALSEQA